jgi:hypothetical protein
MAMLGWQRLGDRWECEGKSCDHMHSMDPGARVWMEAGGACFCEGCGLLRQQPDARRECMAPGCDERIPEGKPASQSTCSRSCGQALRKANAAKADPDAGEPQGAAAL